MLRGLGARLRSLDVWTWAALALAAVGLGFALAPVFAARDLPLVDLPNHLGSIGVWHDYDDPKYGYAQYYTLNRQPVPYWGYFGFVHVLGWFMPLRTASSVYTVLLIVFVPLALAALMRAHGRPAWLAVIFLPLTWGHLMAWGFVQFVSAVGFLFLSWALLARLADARPWPSWKLVAVNVLMGFAIYFMHVLAFLLWLVGLAVYVPRRALALALPSLALFGWQLMSAPRAGLSARSTERLQGIWNGMGRNVEHFHERFVFDFAKHARVDLYWWALLVALALAFVLIEREPTRTADRRPLWLAALLLLAYFLLPMHLEQPLGWASICSRIPLILVPVCFLCLPAGSLPRWKKLAVMAPLVAVSIVHGANVARRFDGFERRTEDFYAVAQHLPYDPSVLVLVYQAGDPSALASPYRHFASYVQVDRGGYNPYAWDNGFPMRLRKGAGKPAPPEGNPAQFNWNAHGVYEYYLTRGEPAGVFSARPGLVLVAEKGLWKLWRKPPA